MITWYEREDFWSVLAKLRAVGRLPSGSHLLEMPFTMLELRERIDIAPVFTPVGDDDFPGPVECWYGEAGDGHFFMLVLPYLISSAIAIIECLGTQDACAVIRDELEAFKRVDSYPRRCDGAPVQASLLD